MIHRYNFCGIELRYDSKNYDMDIISAKEELMNNRKFLILGDYIEKNLIEMDWDLTATLNAKEADSVADFVVIAVPTNVCPKLSVA